MNQSRIIFKSDGKAYYAELPEKPAYSRPHPMKANYEELLRQWEKDCQQALANAIKVKDQGMAKRIVSGRRVDHPYPFSLKGWTVTYEINFLPCGTIGMPCQMEKGSECFTIKNCQRHREVRLAVFTKTDTMEQKQKNMKQYLDCLAQTAKDFQNETIVDLMVYNLSNIQMDMLQKAADAYRNQFSTTEGAEYNKPISVRTTNAATDLEQNSAKEESQNYLEVIKQTREEKMVMYMKFSQKEVCEMLINCNTILENISRIAVSPTEVESQAELFSLVYRIMDQGGLPEERFIITRRTK